jgi:myo-inositol-1-phosphate synthase
MIKDFAPLATLDDLVIGAWDPLPANAYEAALHCGVLNRWEHLDPIKDALEAITPIPAVFSDEYVKNLEGTNVKSAGTKRELAEALRQDIRDFKAANGCDRIVIVWSASTEVFIAPGPVHQTIEALEKGMDENHPEVSPAMLYAYAAIMEGVPFANGAPNLAVDAPALATLAAQRGVPICGKDYKTGQTMIKTVLATTDRLRRSVVVLESQVGDQLFPSKVAQRVLELHELDEDVVLGIQPGRRHRALEVEREPLLHAPHA